MNPQADAMTAFDPTTKAEMHIKSTPPKDLWATTGYEDDDASDQEDIDRYVDADPRPTVHGRPVYGPGPHESEKGS